MSVQSAEAQPVLGKEQIRAIMVGLMVAMFPGALDATIIGPALPTIGRDLGDFDNLAWIATAYLLVSTAVTPLYGKLSDIHGRRVMLRIAIAAFAVGSFLCAIAPTTLLLAAARAVQALGGGGLVSLAMTVIGDIVPPRERPRYQVYTSVMWTTASLLGPVAGGYFAERWNWTVIFWINLPLCMAAWLMTDFRLRNIPRHERPHELDYAGAVLIVVASVFAQLTLNWGGVKYPWSSPVILGLAGASLAIFMLFILRLRTAREPLIPWRLLSSRVILFGAGSAGVTMAVYVALTIYVPVFLEDVRGLSASRSGLALLPLTLCATLGAVAAGRAMILIRRYKIVAICGLFVAAIGLAPMFLWPTSLSLTNFEIMLGVVSIGVGTVFPTTTVSIQNSVQRHDLGTAMSLITFGRNLGGAAGVALFGVVVAKLPAATAGAEAVGETFRWIYAIGAVGFLLAVTLLSFMDEKTLTGASGQLK